MFPWAAWLRKSLPHTDLTIPICQMGSYQTRFLRVLLVLFLRLKLGTSMKGHSRGWRTHGKMSKQGKRRGKKSNTPWQIPSQPDSQETLPEPHLHGLLFSDCLFSLSPGPEQGLVLAACMWWTEEANFWERICEQSELPPCSVPAGAGKVPWNQADMVCESKTVST